MSRQMHTEGRMFAYQIGRPLNPAPRICITCMMRAKGANPWPLSHPCVSLACSRLAHELIKHGGRGTCSNHPSATEPRQTASRPPQIARPAFTCWCIASRHCGLQQVHCNSERRHAAGARDASRNGGWQQVHCTIHRMVEPLRTGGSSAQARGREGVQGGYTR